MPVKMGALLSSRGRFHGRGISDVGQSRFKAEILPAEKHAVRMTNKGSPLPHVRDDIVRDDKHVGTTNLTLPSASTILHSD